MKVFKIYALVLKKIKPRFHYCKKYEERGKYCWTILKKVSYKQLKKKKRKVYFSQCFSLLWNTGHLYFFKLYNYVLCGYVEYTLNLYNVRHYGELEL